MNVTQRIARLAEAAGGRGKRKRLDPNAYRKQHGRCPDGWLYDEADERCVRSRESLRDIPDEPQAPVKPQAPKPPEPPKSPKPPAPPQIQGPLDEPESEKPEKPREPDKAVDKKPPPIRTPEERRKAEDTLERLANKAVKTKNFNLYFKAADKMRAAGLLPDRETAELLVQIEKPDDLKTEDPAELRRIISQQKEQRKHEQRVLKHQIKALENFERQRELAEEAGEQPRAINVSKLMRDIERQYGRALVPDKQRKAAIQEGMKIAQLGMKRSGARPGGSMYDFRKWLERMARPLPKWNKRSNASVTAATDRESWQIGFPPYDQDRVPRRHLPAAPSGRLAFPPYGEFAAPPVAPARDLKMPMFPPYDKHEAPLHPDNIGLPPYNAKPPKTKSYMKQHEQPRPGFPPYNVNDAYRTN